MASRSFVKKREQNLGMKSRLFLSIFFDNKPEQQFALMGTLLPKQSFQLPKDEDQPVERAINGSNRTLTTLITADLLNNSNQYCLRESMIDFLTSYIDHIKYKRKGCEENEKLVILSHMKRLEITEKY